MESVSIGLSKQAGVKTAILIIGDPGGGKSSICRSLTGASRLTPSKRGKAPIYDHVTQGGTHIRTMVIHTSPQEQNVSPKNFLNSSPYSEIVSRRKHYDNLVLALEETYKWPAQDYIDILLSLGFDVRAALISVNPNTALVNYLNKKNIKYVPVPYNPSYNPNVRYDPFKVAEIIRNTIWP